MIKRPRKIYISGSGSPFWLARKKHFPNTFEKNTSIIIISALDFEALLPCLSAGDFS